MNIKSRLPVTFILNTGNCRSFSSNCSLSVLTRHDLEPYLGR